MLKNVRIWCTEGLLTCKDVDLKFAEQGIILEGSNEDAFIPYGSLNLVICKKTSKEMVGLRLKMNKSDKKILDDLLPSVKGGTISKSDKKIYDDILQKEWDRINDDKDLLLKYYPFAVY